MTVPALLTFVVLVLQQPAASALKVERIDVVGTRRYSAADVLKVGGLQQGQLATDADVQQAGRRMVDSGFFKSVRYRYEPVDGAVRLTFEIEEETASVPVIFDNFVWLTDEAIVAALRAEVPAFDGLIPASDDAAVYVARVLQRLIDARGIAGQVQARDRLNTRTGTHQRLFRVNVAGLQLCALHVPGAAAVPESVLVKAAENDIVGKDYSRAFTSDFADGTLRQIYLKRGHLRVAFGPPAASMDAACKGVAVTLPVSEGVAYVWAPAEWVGAAAIAGKDLDGLIGLKRGDVADLTRIDAGFGAVQTAYEKAGYLERRLNVMPKYDDAARTVTFAVSIVEGAQYRMGALELVGFPTAEVANLTKRWRLKPGAVFDGTYLAEFQRDELRRQGATVLAERRLNAETHLVDVRFALK